MLKNQQIISKEKLKDRLGGLANESRFGGDVRELRTRKVIRISARGNSIKLEQAWNLASKNSDVIKITIGEEYAIVKREDFEDAIFAMCQNDETIKYINPKKIINPL